MARKKPEPLVGLSRDPENKLTVQKSRPLTALWQSDLTLAEFKILDAYLARINSRSPGERVVIFTKGELEELLGVKKINVSELKERVVRLMQPIIIQNDKFGFKGIPLFEEADCRQDKDTGLWTVTLECTRRAQKYFFNVEKLGYLRYKLRCVTSLQSRYTYILFIYLESNRFRGSWEVDLAELKQILNCHEDALYSEYKRFNERILKRCQKELSEKTECRFTYEPIRKGRSVSSIRFTLEMLSPKLEAEIQGRDPDQTSIFDDEETDREERERRGEICCGFDDPIFDEFSEEELTEFRSIAWANADPDVEERHYSILHDRKIAREYAVSEFVRLKIQAMNVYAKREPIKNRYSYLKKALSGKDD